MEENVYLNKIQIEPLKELVIVAIEKYSNKKKLKDAIKVTDIVWQKLEYANLVSENMHQQFADITIAACLLHNLFYDGKDISTLFKHRTKIDEIAIEHNLDERIISFMYETIESQLGGQHPIQKLIPQANTPGAFLAEAIWQSQIYKSRV